MRTAHVYTIGALAFTALAVTLAQGAGGAQPAVAEESTPVALPATVDNFMLVDQNLQSHELHRLGDAAAIVIVTQGNGCPVVRNIGPALKALKAAYGPKGVEFLMLNSNQQDTREAVQAEAEEYGFDIPIMMDVNQLVGEQLGVTRTAEVFVIDPKTWKVAYRGPIDDRVTYERQKAKADHPWASQAIDAVMAGKSVKVANRMSPGCLINFPERSRLAEHAKISYSRDVAPIIAQKCASCHQPGGIGPMPLTSYPMVRGFAPMIREVVRTDRMPPFHADPHVGAFNDDKSLSPEQIKTLVHWVEAGARRGDGPDPLAAVKYEAPEWPLGKPDLVLDIPKYTIPATGIVDYQRPVVKNPLTEGRWLKASTVKVSQRQGVHHILTGFMKEVPTDGVARESSWGASVGGYAVGSESIVSPNNVGTYIPAGGAIGFQNHYTPFGKEAVAADQIGLYFYKPNETPRLVMRNGTISDASITIPAGAARHKEVAYTVFPKEALLYSAFPHAHYRGHSSDVTLRYPDGKEKLLLSLPKYDFNWQRHYEFKEPIRVPAGSKLIVTYTYDNSKRNPANPDPDKQVLWGDQSFEEMLFTAVRYRWVDETSADLTVGDLADAAMGAGRTMGMFDDNIDGKIQQAELKGQAGDRLKAAWATVDKNADGALDGAELKAAGGLIQRRRSGQQASR